MFDVFLVAITEVYVILSLFMLFNELYVFWMKYPSSICASISIILMMILIVIVLFLFVLNSFLVTRISIMFMINSIIIPMYLMVFSTPLIMYIDMIKNIAASRVIIFNMVIIIFFLFCFFGFSSKFIASFMIVILYNINYFISRKKRRKVVPSLLVSFAWVLWFFWIVSNDIYYCLCFFCFSVIFYVICYGICVWSTCTYR